MHYNLLRTFSVDLHDYEAMGRAHLLHRFFRDDCVDENIFDFLGSILPTNDDDYFRSTSMANIDVFVHDLRLFPSVESLTSATEAPGTIVGSVQTLNELISDNKSAFARGVLLGIQDSVNIYIDARRILESASGDNESIRENLYEFCAEAFEDLKNLHLGSILPEDEDAIYVFDDDLFFAPLGIDLAVRYGDGNGRDNLEFLSGSDVFDLSEESLNYYCLEFENEPCIAPHEHTGIAYSLRTKREHFLASQGLDLNGFIGREKVRAGKF